MIVVMGMAAGLHALNDESGVLLRRHSRQSFLAETITIVGTTVQVPVGTLRMTHGRESNSQRISETG